LKFGFVRYGFYGNNRIAINAGIIWREKWIKKAQAPLRLCLRQIERTTG